MATTVDPLDLVFLPATRPEDPRFGAAPTRIPGFSAAHVHQVRFPTMVWYSRRVREQAVGQIRSFSRSPVVLVGFSKSGLGAWNITIDAPELVAATVIFDAPVACERPPKWDLSPWYAGQKEWLADLPVRRVDEFCRAVGPSHRLVLIQGELFGGQLAQLSHAMDARGATHTFLPGLRREHHWLSGWIREALEVLSEPPGTSKTRRQRRPVEVPRTRRRRIGD